MIYHDIWIPLWAIYSSIAVLGLCLGSFLNVVIYRLPKQLHNAWQHEARAILLLPKLSHNHFNLCVPRSHCPHCRHPLVWRDNIPVISYLSLKGRCRYCMQKIAWHYPIIELLSAGTAIFLVWHFGMTWQALTAYIFSMIILSLSAIDFKYLLLPDTLTLSLLWLGLLVNLQSTFANTQAAILGAVLGYGGLRFIAEIFSLITKKEGLGLGDCKLLAALGAWLGWQLLPFIVFGSAILGLLAGGSLILFRRHTFKQALPYGPYLAAMGWLMLIWGQSTTNFYWQFLLHQ